MPGKTVDGISEWKMPEDLESADFYMPAPQKIIEPPLPPHAEFEAPPPQTPKPESDSSSKGLDPSMLLSLLGNSNSQIAPLLGLLKGEKPDILSLLPLLMQLNTKKETPKTSGSVPLKTLNLNDYPSV